MIITCDGHLRQNPLVGTRVKSRRKLGTVRAEVNLRKTSLSFKHLLPVHQAFKMYEKARHQVAVIPVETIPCDVESDSTYRNSRRLIFRDWPHASVRQQIPARGKLSTRGMESAISES